jgi:predicted nucleotidyltransferase
VPYTRRVSTFGRVLRELDASGAGFVLVGGVAVVLHGYARLTADIDLVVDLRPGQAVRAIAALGRLGMEPRAPVAARDFADPDIRRTWIEEKGMRVFSMHDPRHPLVEVDLFVDPPIPYDELRARAVSIRLEGLDIAVASIQDLIAMKELAARPKDFEDIAALRAIEKSRGR